MRALHLGLGSFHRAHQALYTQDAGDGWTETGVASRSRRVVQALREQGMRYTVVTIDGASVAVRPVDVVTEALVAADEPEAVLARLADPRTRVVTLTVTEAGYSLRPGSRSLDLDDPAVRADLARGDGTAGGAAAPVSTVGLLCRGLARRAAAGAEPLAVVSCDNLTGNGEVLRTVTGEFAAAAGMDELSGYLAHVGFPSTMVDRIVPATTPRHVELAAAAGFADAVPVPAEPFTQWVVQPDFPAGRPAWERAGAVLSDDVHAWEEVKVRMLNGTHSLLAYLGLLRGRVLIADAFADDPVRRAAQALGDEYAPTLAVPPELDLDDYRGQLARRFSNAALGHRTAQVGTDGSLKLAQRVPEPVVWHLQRGSVPSALALLVAAFLTCTARPDLVDEARTGRPADPAAQRLRQWGSAHSDGPGLARAVLVDEALLGPSLAGATAFVARVGELADVLARRGTDAAITEVLA